MIGDRGCTSKPPVVRLYTAGNGEHIVTDQPSNATRTMTWEEMQHLTLWVTDKLQDSLHRKIRLERTPDTLQLIHERFGLLCQHTNIRRRVRGWRPRRR